MSALIRSTYQLSWRALRETVRQPGVEIQNIFIPLFFFATGVGALSSVAAGAFEIDNYTGFQLPVAFLTAIAGAASISGLAAVLDIERGYLDKLLLTPAPRSSLVLGRMLADSIRGALLMLIILIVGLIAGSGLETGVAGALVILAIGALFGMAYSAIGLGLGLRTGNLQAAQAGLLIFFPLLFLSPAFAPTNVFAPWLDALATVNPVTYILTGIRTLVLEGWDGEAIGLAFGCTLGLGTVTTLFAFWGLRHRTR